MRRLTALAWVVVLSGAAGCGGCDPTVERPFRFDTDLTFTCDPEGTFPQFVGDWHTRGDGTFLRLDGRDDFLFWDEQSRELVPVLETTKREIKVFARKCLPGQSTFAVTDRIKLKTYGVGVLQNLLLPPPPPPVIYSVTDADTGAARPVFAHDGRDPETSKPHRLRIKGENFTSLSVVSFVSPAGETLLDVAPDFISPEEIVVDAASFPDLSNGIVKVRVKEDAEEDDAASNPGHYYIGAPKGLSVLFVNRLPEGGQSGKVAVGLGNATSADQAVTGLEIQWDDAGTTSKQLALNKRVPANQFRVIDVPTSRSGDATDPATGTLRITAGPEGGPASETTYVIEATPESAAISVDGDDSLGGGLIDLDAGGRILFGQGDVEPLVIPVQEGLSTVEEFDYDFPPFPQIIQNANVVIRVPGPVAKRGGSASYALGEFVDLRAPFTSDDVGKWIVFPDHAFKIVGFKDATKVTYDTAGEDGIGDTPEWVMKTDDVVKGSGTGAWSGNSDFSYDLQARVPDGIIEPGDTLVLRSESGEEARYTVVELDQFEDHTEVIITGRRWIRSDDDIPYYDGPLDPTKWSIENAQKVHAAALVNCSFSTEDTDQPVDATFFCGHIEGCTLEFPSGSRVTFVSEGRLNFVDSTVSCGSGCVLFAAAKSLVLAGECLVDCTSDRGGACTLLGGDIAAGSDVAFICDGTTSGGTWFAAAAETCTLGCSVECEPAGSIRADGNYLSWWRRGELRMSASGGKGTAGGTCLFTGKDLEFGSTCSVYACGGANGDGGDVICVVDDEICLDGALCSDGGDSDEGVCGNGGTAHGIHDVAASGGLIEELYGLPWYGMLTYFDDDDELAKVEYYWHPGLDADSQRAVLEDSQTSFSSRPVLATGGVTLFCDRFCGQGSLSSSGGNALTGTSARGGNGGSIYVYANRVETDASFRATGGTPDGDAIEPAVQVLARSSVDLGGVVDGSGGEGGNGGLIWFMTLQDRPGDATTTVILRDEVRANGALAGRVLVTGERRPTAGENSISVEVSADIEAIGDQTGSATAGIAILVSGTLEETLVAQANSNATAPGTLVVLGGSLVTTGGRVLILCNGGIEVPGMIEVETGDINIVSNILGVAPGGPVMVDGTVSSLAADWKTMVDGHLPGAILLAGTQDVTVGANGTIKGNGDNGAQIAFNGDTITIEGLVDASGDVFGGIIFLDATDMRIESGALVKALGLLGGAIQFGVIDSKPLPVEVDAKTATIAAGATVDMRGSQQDGVLAIGDPDLGDPLASFVVNGTVFAIFFPAGDS